MGTVGREIVGTEEVGGIIEELNRGIAAEVNDAYRYLLLANLASGLHAKEPAEFFERTAQDEWRHAGTLMRRVAELGGRPMNRPSDAADLSYAEYRDPPKRETDVRSMVEDSLAGERAAIRFYRDLEERTHHVDPVTAQIAREALADEVADEDELERLLEDWPGP